MMRYLSILAYIVLIGATAIAGDLLRRTEARRFYSLPGHEYRGPQASNPVTGVSQLAIPLTYSRTIGHSDNEEVVRIKVFQMDSSELRNNHCQLTKVALTIHQDGKWTMNFTATQNPDLLPSYLRPSFERFDRNLFCVSVYGEALYKIGESTDSPVGKPELFHIFLQPYVIEKRQSTRLVYSGESREISRYFDIIDRVEVDLRYR